MHQRSVRNRTDAPTPRGLPRGIARLALILFVFVGTTLQTLTGAYAGSEQGAYANLMAGTFDGFLSPASQALVDKMRADQSVDQFNRAKYGMAGTVKPPSTGGVSAKGKAGLVLDVAGAALSVIGVGSIPGLGGLFGGSNENLPVVVSGVTDATSPTGTPTQGDQALCTTTNYPAGTPSVYSWWSATRTAAVNGSRFYNGGLQSACTPSGGGQLGGSWGFQLTLAPGQTLYYRNYFPTGSYYEMGNPRNPPAVNPSACSVFASSSGSQLDYIQTGINRVARAFYIASTAGGVAAGCSGEISAYWSRSPVPFGGGSVTDQNPNRWIEVTAHCKFPDGTIVTRTGQSATFKRASNATGSYESPATPEVFCPDGSLLIDASGDVVTEGSTTRVPAMAPYTVNPDKAAKMLGDYSDCLSTLCVLHVVRLVPELDCASRKPAAGHPCQDWSKASDLSTNWQCRYGTHVFDMSLCSSLKNAYGATGTITPNEGTTPVTAPTGTDPMEDPTPEQTPGYASSGCVPSGWNVVNPFAYGKAITCALKWAFVPSGSVQDRVSALQASFSGKFPFSAISQATSWANGSTGLVPVAAGASDCPSWKVKVGDQFSGEVLCGTEYGDAIRGLRPVLAGLALTAMFWPLLRSIWYAAIPVLNVRPTS